MISMDRFLLVLVLGGVFSVVVGMLLVYTAYVRGDVRTAMVVSNLTVLLVILLALLSLSYVAGSIRSCDGGGCRCR